MHSFTYYDDLEKEFGVIKLNSKYLKLYQLITSFIESEDNQNIAASLSIDANTLYHVIQDYFTDISRLKEFHKTGKVNIIKRTAYECYWMLRRKPIQVNNAPIDVDFINESFVLTYLISVMTYDMDESISSMPAFKEYVLVLMYQLKYRNTDAQVLEIILQTFLSVRNLYKPFDIEVFDSEC